MIALLVFIAFACATPHSISFSSAISGRVAGSGSQISTGDDSGNPGNLKTPISSSSFGYSNSLSVLATSVSLPYIPGSSVLDAYALTSYSATNDLVVGTITGFQPSKSAGLYPAGSGAFTGWYRATTPAGDLVPGVLVNNNAGPASVLPGLISPQTASSMWAHVGSTDTLPPKALVLRFKAPTSGTVTSTSVSFAKLHTSPVNWSIEIGGTLIATGDTNTGSTPSFTNQAIASGQNLDFIIYTTNYGATSTEIVADFIFRGWVFAWKRIKGQKID